MTSVVLDHLETYFHDAADQAMQPEAAIAQEKRKSRVYHFASNILITVVFP